ncbi:MAG: cupin domain-containing protein [Proteobacteria bacterium]|nr:cupin domain-containing protein [Pseudomonadota bacterium]
MNETNVPATREVIHVGQLEIRYVKEADGACQMACFELRAPPNSNVTPHSHSASEELGYVLEETLPCTVGSEMRDLQPGDAVATPRGVVHAFSNPHAAVARALVINTPDIGTDYFEQVGSIINASGPPDRVALLATMRRFGLKPVTLPETPQR